MTSWTGGVYQALSRPRSRYLCYALFEATEWDLEDLATRIAAWELDVPEHDVTPAQDEQMRLSLYHAHVPKLADAGILRYDAETATITTGPHATTVLAALRGIGRALAWTREPHPEDDMGDDEAPRGRG